MSPYRLGLSPCEILPVLVFGPTCWWPFWVKASLVRSSLFWFPVNQDSHMLPIGITCLCSNMVPEWKTDHYSDVASLLANCENVYSADVPSSLEVWTHLPSSNPAEITLAEFHLAIFITEISCWNSWARRARSLPQKDSWGEIQIPLHLSSVSTIEALCLLLQEGVKWLQSECSSETREQFASFLRHHGHRCIREVRCPTSLHCTSSFFLLSTFWVSLSSRLRCVWNHGDQTQNHWWKSSKQCPSKWKRLTKSPKNLWLIWSAIWKHHSQLVHGISNPLTSLLPYYLSIFFSFILS